MRDHFDTVSVSTDQVQVLDCLVVNREEAHSRTILWRHVSDGRSIDEGKVGATWSEELDELSDDTTLSEHLSASKDEIGRGRVRGQITSKLKANDLGEHHGDLLAEHDGLSLNTTDTPAYNTEAIDHSGVGVCTDDGVWVQDAILLENDARKEFKVDLMDDTVAGWHDTEV